MFDEYYLNIRKNSLHQTVCMKAAAGAVVIGLLPEVGARFDEPDQEHLPGIPKKSPLLPPANAQLATAQLQPDELATSVSFSKEDEVIGNYPFRRYTSQPENVDFPTRINNQWITPPSLSR
ncbi:uncharacterized protein LOC120417490 [Culex pipiens pallens]|uniref:uncharacterized protein LOC120417490 n=1 Tax=Culex pipiens pallens TaxID=42434 RepID=UPI00195477FD|nr:uncharacterized protein LOC120417490 [Culex pipiens pallens]